MTELGSDAARVRRAAAALRSRGEATRDLEGGPVPSASAGAAAAAGGVHPPVDPGRDWVPPWRRRAMWLRDLRSRFAGVTLDDTYDVDDCDVDGCRVRRIAHHLDLPPPDLPDPTEARAAVLARLQLVAGVGEVTEGRLRNQGFATIAELTASSVHGPAATEVLAEWESGDLTAIAARLTRRLGGRGHLLSSVLCGLVDLDDLVFLDLETLGFWNTTVFLAGVGRFRAGRFAVEQFLAPRFEDEPGVLSLAAAALGDARVVVTFNGRTADLPWLSNRVFFHGLPTLPRPAHIDLSYGVRRRFRLDQELLPDTRLATVQHRLLDLARPDGDVPGWFVPDVYEHYAQQPERRQGLLVPVLDHNRSDLEALVGLLGLLCGEVRAWA